MILHFDILLAIIICLVSFPYSLYILEWRRRKSSSLSHNWSIGYWYSYFVLASIDLICVEFAFIIKMLLRIWSLLFYVLHLIIQCLTMKTTSAEKCCWCSTCCVSLRNCFHFSKSRWMWNFDSSLLLKIVICLKCLIIYKLIGYKFTSLSSFFNLGKILSFN